MVRKDSIADKENSAKTAGQSRLDGLKFLIPQIVSTSIASCFCIIIGLSNSFPAILIAHINKTNLTTDNELAISENGLKWFVSCGALVSPISALMTGIVVDYFGRLNSLRLAGIFCIAGWILLYSAKYIVSLILGRLLLNFASAWFITSVSTYVAEISSPNIRGTLLNVKVFAITFGMFSSFLLASYVNWRTLTLFNMTLVIACCIMSMFLHESALWLITKTRITAARNSLISFNRFKKIEKKNFDGMIECELHTLEKLYKNRHETKYKGLQKCNFFLQPFGYKPLLIVTGLYFFQEFSGHTIIFLHLITLFEEFGTDINPYNAAVYVTAAKFLTTVCNFWFMNRFYRRTLLLVSCIGMAVSMMVTALGVKLLKEGLMGYNWMSLCGLICYSCSCSMGMLLIPRIISTELFPTYIRGTGQALGSVISSLLEVSAIQCYYFLKNISSLPQRLILFGLMSLIGSLFIYAFVPETHRKILAETENIYSTSPKHMRGARRATNKAATVMLPIRT